MAQYKTPDVYVQEKSTLPPSVAEVPTAIPVFVGYTAITVNSKNESVTMQPIKIKNMAEYRSVFGGKAVEKFGVHIPYEENGFVIKADINNLPSEDGQNILPKFMLAQSVEHFFANGGGACYVVSIGNHKTADATGLLTDTTPVESDFNSALSAISKVDEITLISLIDAHGLNSTAYYSLQTSVIKQCEDLQDRFALIDVLEKDTSALLSAQITADADLMRNNVTGDLKYGAAYYPNVLTSYARHYDKSSVTVKYYTPDNAGGQNEVIATLSALETSNTALFNSVKQILAKNYLVLPPTPAIAGVIAKTDASRGVWKAPANVALTMVQRPTKVIKNDDQDNLNVDSIGGKSINAIRQFTGKGNLVWGARTLAGNDNEWRYISVRRLFNMVEESIQKASAFAVFEPNTPFTWLKLKTMIESYLENLWKQGAFMGESAGQAYFVNVGLGQTMTEDDINNGIMHIEIGLAAVRPAEFIVLTFSHKSLES
jgi:phage tail sheath protein FI